MKATKVDLFHGNARLVDDHVARSAAVSIIAEYELVTVITEKRKLEHRVVAFVSPNRANRALSDLVSASLGLSNIAIYLKMEI